MLKIEEIARAIYSIDPLIGAEMGVPLDFAKTPKFIRELAFKRAFAAVITMREPNVAMLVAGNDEPTSHSWGRRSTVEDKNNYEFAEGEPIWEAMINAILNEKSDA